MGEWFGTMSGLERIFSICAFIGIILFLARMVLQFMGGDDGGDADIGDSDASFHYISVQGVTVFLLMFGLIGRALLLGGFFGVVAYATYDLTNLATLRGFPTTVAAVDIVWGGVLTATVATVGYLFAARGM